MIGEQVDIAEIEIFVKRSYYKQSARLQFVITIVDVRKPGSIHIVVRVGCQIPAVVRKNSILPREWPASATMA
jgi:hypothetical protein